MKENSRKYLIFLTAGFPFGNGETFIENELPFLSQAFEKVYIVVPAGAATQPKRVVAGNVEVISATKSPEIFNRLKALICPDFWKGLLMDLNRTNRLTGALNVFRSCWNYFSRALATKKTILHTLTANNLKPENTIFYSYWLDEKALGMALVKKKMPTVKAISRAHGWDVYEDRHQPPYLPFRPWLFKTVDKVAVVSKKGVNYLNENFELPKGKVVVSYLGTEKLKGKGEKKSLKHSIVSCSNLIPLKRVDLIIEALSLLDHPISWTHIGDGPLREELEQKSAFFFAGKDIEFSFLGQLTNKQVRDIYEIHHFDLFMSTSETEGLPVSMMEAQSAGVPILATNVGGVSEIVVDGVTGWLLPAIPSLNLVAERIREIYELPDTEKRKISENAFGHWQNNFQAEENYAAFVSLLKSI